MLLRIILLTALAAAATAHPSAHQRTRVRPCNFDDLKCIGDNLAANSKCNQKVVGSIPSQYIVKNFHFEAPFFNSSYIETEVLVKNHNLCHVSEFFVNEKADSMVLSLDCPSFAFEADTKVIRHTSLMEDLTYHFMNKAFYPLIRLTSNLKHADHLDICTSFVFTDVTALPILQVDPLDKPTDGFLSTDLSVLNIFEREAFLYKGYPLFRNFVNAYICDFGCTTGAM